MFCKLEGTQWYLIGTSSFVCNTGLKGVLLFNKTLNGVHSFVYRRLPEGILVFNKQL